MSCNNIITITRQYGSGGHNIGKALSERLAFHSMIRSLYL